MPHVDDLNTALQTALKRPIPARSTVEIVLDPDGDAIDLSDYLDVDSSLTVRRSKQIQPNGSLGKYSIGEVNANFINRDNFFNRNKIGKQFYYATDRIIVEKGANDGFIRLVKGNYDLIFNDAGITQLWLDDGVKKTAFTISSVITTFPDYDQINFSGTGNVSYPAGSIVETRYWPGTSVRIRTEIAEAGEFVDQFFGVIKGHPTLNNDGTRARITFFDQFRTLLDVDCKANDYRYIINSSGHFLTTLNYERKNNSTGTIDLSKINIFEDCPIGEWRIEWKYDKHFLLFDPEGNLYRGRTDQALITPAQPSNENWLTIFNPATFNGNFDLGDVIRFRTVLNLGLPTNNYGNVPNMIKKLLTESFGAGLNATDLEESSFDDLITEYDEMFGGITFSEPVTVLKAIEILQQHFYATVFYNASGKVALYAYRPQRDPATIRSFSPDADIIRIDTQDLGRIDSVQCFFDYDYANKKFVKDIKIPSGAAAGEKALVIRLPAYHQGDAQPRSVAERIWITWRKGVQALRIKEKWNYGLALEVNDLLYASSDYPEVPQRLVEVYSVQVDLLKKTVELDAFEPGYSFANFAFVGYSNLDRGFLAW